jgi:mono/diheme cytochrome c family protein
MPAGRIVAFALDGAAQLPAPPPSSPKAALVRSSQAASPGDLAAGQTAFIRYCAVCHGGSLTPDLSRSSVLSSPEAWRSVVLDGALKDAGMVGFSAYMSPGDAEQIRAYLLSTNAGPAQ